MVRSQLEQELPASGLLDLHSALEEMERLSMVAEKAVPPPAPPPPAELAPWFRLTDRIEVLPEEPPVAIPSLPVESRAAFEILHPRCPPKWAEAIRKLRGRVLEERTRWEAAGRRLGSVAIVSPRRAGGRSTTARNLAACLGALPETKVLLVDADAVAPSLHRRLRVSREPGLTEAISGTGGDWLQHVRRLPDSGLHVLTYGAAGVGIDPLPHGRLPAFLDRACSEFAWVILDVPAMESADGEALSGVTDGTVLVLRNRHEYFDEADAAARRLDPARLLGAILNYA
jgi:Mrp family chromosome partitioning ATPase